MPYLLRNVDTGAFVSKQGTNASYTRKIEHARRYTTTLEAHNDKCGNEHVVFYTHDQLKDAQ